jgi:PAS domain S-box-containing protein
MPFSRPSSALNRYSIAVVSTAIALAICMTLDPLLGYQSPFILFIPAILLTARVAGRGPGFLATALSVLSGYYFLVEPRFSFVVSDRKEILVLAILALIGIGATLITSPPIDNQSPAPANPDYGLRRLGRIAVLGGVFVTIVIVTRLMRVDLDREQEARAWVIHTYQVLDEIHHVESSLLDSESSKRAYLLTGNNRLLQQYRDARSEEQAAWRSLLRLTAGNADQQKRLLALDRLIQAGFTEYEREIAQRLQGRAGAALEASNGTEPEPATTQYRSALKELKDEVNLLLERRIAAADRQGESRQWILGLGFGSLLILLVGAGALIERDAHVREQSNERIKQSEERLRLALTAANAGAWEWDIESNRLLCSDEFRRLFGLEPDNREFDAQALRKFIDEDDLPAVERVASAAVSTKSDLNIEYRMKGLDGTERWLLAIAEPFLDQSGKLCRYAGIVVDVTERKRLEKEAIESESQFRTLANAIPQLCWMANSDGWVFWFNHRWYDYTGKTPEEMQGWGWQSVLALDTMHAVVKRWKASIASGDPFDMTVPLRGADGVIRPFLTRVMPVRNPNGGVIRWVGTNTDISDQLRIERALRESEEKYYTLVEHAADAIFLHDFEGRFVDVNQRACDSVGYTRDALLSMTVFDIECDFDLPRAQTTWSSMVPGEPLTVSGRHRHKDGSIFPIEARLGTMLIGGKRYFLALVRDVRGRVQMERALRESERRYRVLFESMNQGLVLLEILRDDKGEASDCVFLAGNLAFEQQFDLEAGSYLGRTLLELFPGTDTAHVQLYGKVARTAEPARFEFLHEPLGRFFDVAAFQTEPGRCGVITTDITERRQAQARVQQLNADLENRVRDRTSQLEAANRELEAFSYSVSHDLRAPLRGIDGWSMALVDDYGDRLDPQARLYLSRVRAETQRMGTLIDDLLQLSRVTRSPLRCENVNVTAIAERIARQLKELNPNRRIEFKIAKGLTTRGDTRLLTVAMTNLMDNAAKFTGTRDNARIEVGQARDRDGLPFYVRDNGVGFNMAYAGKLFIAFQRLHRPSDFPGTGIGLATVQRVIARHNGRIWAEAKPDEGATFYFTVEAGA